MSGEGAEPKGWHTVGAQLVDARVLMMIITICWGMFTGSSQPAPPVSPYLEEVLWPEARTASLSEG